MKKNLILGIVLLCTTLTSHAAMTWSWAYAPSAYSNEIATSMDGCVATWNTYANYNANIPVAYNAGVPTAQASYQGWIEFGGSRNYRVAMHESAHWFGTGSVYEWDLHQRYSIWNGTYCVNLRRAFDGPGARQFIYGVHYGPDGANYDSEWPDDPRFVGIVGAFSHDMDLAAGDQTIGIASGTYRLRNRATVKVLDSVGAAASGDSVKQNENHTGNGPLWNVSLQTGTIYFTIQNAANGLYLDTLGGANGDPVGMSTLSGSPTDNQLWSIMQTDSFFFKIVNKGTGRALDNLGSSVDGATIAQWDSGGSWNQQWTFLHTTIQPVAPAGVVSQGRTVSASSWGDGLFPEYGNNGVSSDRWTALDGTFPQWWYVDTGEVQPISKVEVDWFPGGVFQYQIEVSDDASTWTVVADRTGNASSGTTVDHLSGVNARFVKVNITGTTTGGWAAFMECRVYNEAESLKQLSPFRPATASSEQAGNLAVNANDVDPVFTRWCANSSGYPAWWQVDLGEVKTVNRAVIQWFDDNGRSYQYRIEGSTNGVDYTTLADRTGNTTAYTTSDDFSGEARYVRVTVTGGTDGWPSFYDAQIYGETVMPPTELSGSLVSGNIDLAWTASGGAASYNVKRSTVSGGPYTTLANVTGTTYTDTDASEGSTYYYVVSSVGTEGESDPSVEVGVTMDGTIAYWNFEDGTNGVPFTDTTSGAYGGSGGSVDIVNGMVMRGWDNYWGAYWTNSTPPNGGSLAMDCDAEHQDAYVMQGALMDWSSPEWTLELQVRFDDFDSGWCTMVGRDGSNFGVSESDFYFQRMGDGSGKYRINYRTADGVVQNLASDTALVAGVWYSLAVVCDTSAGTITLYVDDGTGYVQDGQLTGLSGNLGVYSSGLQWSFGRGWYGEHSDRTDAQYDNIRFSNGALAVEDLIPLNPPPSVPVGLSAVSTNQQISLSWNASTSATSYKVQRSLASEGPYAVVSTPSGTNSIDSGVTNGITYYYMVRAVGAGGESADSSVVSAVPSAAISPEEFVFAGLPIVGEVYVYLSLSGSVPGHLYQVLATDNLVTPDWQPEGAAANGDGSDLLFEIPFNSSYTNHFYKLHVQRQ